MRTGTTTTKVSLTHCILVDFSTVICWTSLLVILGVSGLYGRVYMFSLFFMENPVSKQWRP